MILQPKKGYNNNQQQPHIIITYINCHTNVSNLETPCDTLNNKFYSPEVYWNNLDTININLDMHYLNSKACYNNIASQYNNSIHATATQQPTITLNNFDCHKNNIDMQKHSWNTINFDIIYIHYFNTNIHTDTATLKSNITNAFTKFTTTGIMIF